MPAKCKQREHLRESGLPDVPALPVAAVKGILCFRCLEPATKLFKCGACRRPSYCSKECQKLDWAAVHKKQCKVLQHINSLELKDYKDARTWDQYRRSLLQHVREVRTTTGSRDAEFIVQAQPYCSTCRRSSYQLASKDTALESCAACRLVHHCSGCSLVHSKPVCTAYQIQSKIEQFRIELFEDTGKMSAMTCTQEPRHTYSPLSNCAGWYDYYINISDKAQIKGNIIPDFSGIAISALGKDSRQDEFEERRRLFLLVATDTLTMPLTITSGLEHLQLESTTKLKVHLLGATGREFLAMPSFEEILHLLPGIKTLALTTIGPSGLSDYEQEYVPAQNIECCPECTALARKRTFASYRGLYHDFAKSTFYEKPDIIVAFNSGCADGDDAESDWTPTLRLIVDSDVPALFTTYNAEEAGHERQKFGRLGASFVVEPAKNRWSSLVPEPEFLDKEFDMWYQNCYYYIIQGGK